MKCIDKKKKRGISLIVLVITIIVILIIAGAVILTVNHNNPVGNAKQATWKDDIRGMQESISLYIARFSKDQLDPDVSKYMNITETTQFNGKNAFQEIFGNSFEKYFTKVAIVNGALHMIGSNLTEEELTWAKELNINII